MERAGMDRGIRTFLRSGLKAILWLVAICILLGYLGVPMTSLVAVLSVLGLALSLAIQGILSNLAGGIMIVSTRPFGGAPSPDHILHTAAAVAIDSDLGFGGKEDPGMLPCHPGDTVFYRLGLRVFDLQEQVKEAFDKAGVEMTYDHLNVHIKEKSK